MQLYFDFIPDREHSYEEVTGTVKTLLYDNPYTNWKVIEILPDNSDEKLKLTGYLPNIAHGDRISAGGTINDHPVFGQSLQIDEFNKELPFHKKGVIKYMISMVDGIGEHLAESIVEKFHEDTLQILEDDPDRLLEIDGINSNTIERIKKSTESINTAVKELILIGFSPKWAGRIYLKYGKVAAELVKRDPYRLIKNFKGIGFKKAELIAQKIGIDPLNENRINAAIYFSLRSTLRKTGHNFLYLDDLKKTAARLLRLPHAYVESAIITNPALAIAENRIYLPQHYQAEQEIALKISEKITLPRIKIQQFDKLMEKMQAEIDIQFSTEQLDSIRMSIEDPITVITGAAGTGKTTLCIGLIKLLDYLDHTYSVCAPTGKAANKLKTATGHPASTIHRLLEYAPASGYRKNENNPLVVDYLIVDEASMVDLLLLEAICVIEVVQKFN
ncbi:helix-hairpin-helix domain-containing protein, partial [Elusimicrobiota bacterium]